MIAPSIILGFALIVVIKCDIAKITIFEAAMPTVITSSMIAEQFKLNTKLINLIIGSSILVGFFTVSLWYQIIEFFF